MDEAKAWERTEAAIRAAARPNLIYLLGLACGLAETAEELREGKPVDPDYLDRVGDALWAYVGNPDRRAIE